MRKKEKKPNREFFFFAFFVYHNVRACSEDGFVLLCLHFKSIHKVLFFFINNVGEVGGDTNTDTA